MRATPVVALTLAACGGGDAPSAPTPPPSAALAYLEGALDVMEQHSIRRREIDWPQFRADAVARLGAARTVPEAHPAVDATVRAIGDGHSRFYPPSRLPNRTDQPPSAESIVSGRRLGDVAYVYVPGFGGPNPTGRVDSTLAVLRALDGAEPAPPPCGWIVDLRLNTGGNMYPMIAGIGPVLGDGVAGGFVPPGGGTISWFHRAGSAGSGSSQSLATATTPYALRRPGVPVAVLYGALTASSGEAVAISFRGGPHARSFGTETRGLSTANQGFALSDGAIISLTTAAMADRAGTVYGGRLVPDERVPASGRPVPGVVDETVSAAQRWLRAQPACTIQGAAS